MAYINDYGARSGRMIKADGTTVNQADGIKADGTQLVEITGINVAEQLTQANAVTGTLTFAANIKTIGIFNTDTVNNGVFNVNGIDITVPPNTPFEANIGGTPRNTVSITGASSYIVTRYV